MQTLQKSVTNSNDISTNEKKRIGVVVIFFSMHMALMLYQAEGLGTISAFLTLALTIMACLISGSVSCRAFYLPRASQCILLFLIFVSVVTFIVSGVVPNYYKFVAQIFLFLFLASVSIDSREHDYLKWVFILANIFYSLFAIRYCLLAGNGRYYHSSIILFGASFDPNYIGISLVATLVILLDKILTSSKRILCIILYFIISVTVVLTASRGNMIGWMFSNALIVLFFGRNKGVRGAKRWVPIILLFLLMAIFINYVSDNYASQWTRMSYIAPGADNGRFALWGETISLWKKSPIFGNGLRSMYNTFGRASHNTYLQILSDSGLVGSVLMLTFFVTLIKNAYKCDKVMFAVLSGLLVQMAFLDAMDNRVIWIIFCWIAMLASSRGVSNLC